jgi:hypothetical protein
MAMRPALTARIRALAGVCLWSFTASGREQAQLVEAAREDVGGGCL